jgi:hypothetical protein
MSERWSRRATVPGRSATSSNALEAGIREDWDDLANDREAEHESAISQQLGRLLQLPRRFTTNVETIRTSCLL